MIKKGGTHEKLVGPTSFFITHEKLEGTPVLKSSKTKTGVPTKKLEGEKKLEYPPVFWRIRRAGYIYIYMNMYMYMYNRTLTLLPPPPLLLIDLIGGERECCYFVGFLMVLR